MRSALVLGTGPAATEAAEVIPLQAGTWEVRDGSAPLDDVLPELTVAGFGHRGDGWEWMHNSRDIVKGWPEGLPPLLFILAPEPSPLLVQRVQAWGGNVWECKSGYAKWPTIKRPNISCPTSICDAPTWGEVVRAALECMGIRPC